MKELELLAPAKNLECGMAAIDHGADAVYIGPPLFGARAAAGNSVADIATLCQYAHQYDAKVYATVNTLLHDDELPQALELLGQLADAQVDAVLIQDMRLVPNRLQPLRLGFHASTQADARTAQKVEWLWQQGFSRAVLARELTIDEVATIHAQVPQMELEVFVHGALCVSYSGLCYASEYCFNRSANRGECAQFCRMKFDLIDADGNELLHQQHLLSLKDLNLSRHLHRLIEAGATSFKIEGRLKDIAYVKNVTAAYSELLNQYIAHHPDRYVRASRGRCTYTFQPHLDRTFNRGYTTYFADGRQPAQASFFTPKAIGQQVGQVKELRPQWLTMAGTAAFANGDGLCFFDDQQQLQGFRVNRVEGNRLFPQRIPEGLRRGMPLFRSNDQQMERTLAKPSAERKIPVVMSLRATPDGFALSMDGHTVQMAIEHQQAKSPQRQNIIDQLCRLGGTPYECTHVDLPDDFNYFIPSSQLAEWRRQLVSSQQNEVESPSLREGRGGPLPTLCEGRGGPLPSLCEDHGGLSREVPPPAYDLPYLYNAANREARRFYAAQGVAGATSFEAPAGQSRPSGEVLLMQCRHCIRYSLGCCVKHGGQRPRWREPLFLVSADGRRFRLEFDCKKCQMNVYGN